MLLYLGQWVPHGRVLAIEPGKHPADWLQECLEANPQLRVELLRVALGSRRQQAHLKEVGGTDRHGSWNQVSNLEGEPINVVPLTELLRERNIEHVDLWKLDVEGFEIPALEGAEWYLSERRIRSLYIELRGDNGRMIRDFLGRFGYDCRLFNWTGSLYSPIDLPEESNGLFMPAN
jgi:FkbM family methyltransferase